MYVLDDDEIAQVSGGNLYLVLALYAAADIGYQFYQGYKDGLAGK